MPLRPSRAPRFRRIRLGDLVRRRGHANVLSRRARETLARHIRQTHLYPPLIVRPHPRRAGKFEILDGHNRAEVLQALGARHARCEVWDVPDEQADLLVVCLNSLRGRPDGRARARQVRRLVKPFGRDGAAEMLGITPRALTQQLEALRRPRASVGGCGLDLRPVVFHLNAKQSQLLGEALRRFGTPGGGRADALAAALQSTRAVSSR